jgi:hypothetical protein
VKDVEFQVWFSGALWFASATLEGVFIAEGDGETPVTALMIVEAKARRFCYNRASKVLQLRSA